MSPFLAYIDPGSGSLIIQAAIAAIDRHPDLLPLADRSRDAGASAL